MADKIGFKRRNGHFGANLRLLETDFQELDISTAKYKKKTFLYVVCRGNSHLLKYDFGICLCSNRDNPKVLILA